MNRQKKTTRKWIRSGIDIKRGIEGENPVSLEPHSPHHTDEKQMVKIEITLDHFDHPEFDNLRESITPIHIRLILGKYGLRPCRISVSEIRPKRQNAIHNAPDRQNPNLDDALRRLEDSIRLFHKERTDNPLDIVFEKDSSCLCPCCRNTRRQSRNGS